MATAFSGHERIHFPLGTARTRTHTHTQLIKKVMFSVWFLMVSPTLTPAEGGCKYLVTTKLNVKTSLWCNSF